MKQYKLNVANQVYDSLGAIYENKRKYDVPSAKRFAEGCLRELEKLSTLPHRGANLSGEYKSRSYQHHLIIYQIIEPDEVRVLDIVDPKQHTVASKYY